MKTIQKENKGLYYNQIINMLAYVVNGTIIGYKVSRLYSCYFKGIYDTINGDYKRTAKGKQEFIFSMKKALADVFGDGSEVDIPEGAFDFLDKIPEISEINWLGKRLSKDLRKATM